MGFGIIYHNNKIIAKLYAIATTYSKGNIRIIFARRARKKEFKMKQKRLKRKDLISIVASLFLNYKINCT